MKCLVTGTRRGEAELAALVGRRPAGARLRHVEPQVRAILEAVRREGDQAVLRATRRFDGLRLSRTELVVSRDEIARGARRVDPAVQAALRLAARRITTFHARQRRQGFALSRDGTRLSWAVRPLERVGLYVPGGTAAYPSSVLMGALPARAAGVREVILCSPGATAPALLAAATLSGVSAIYRIGGAQAIAAMAYGTETVPRVDKIVGPGNIWVTTAKRLVSGEVGIDMLAGPSEVAIIADETAHPVFLAADLLAEAEHDVEAWAVLITPSRSLVTAVNRAVARQLSRSPRRAILATALQRRGVAVLVRNLGEAVEVANRLAPEHLELAVRRPEVLAGRVRTAGALFLGHWSPSTLGDYVAGPNHILPTGGTARFASPLSVNDFVRTMNVIGYTRAALRADASAIEHLARVEGLDAHAEAIRVRLP